MSVAEFRAHRGGRARIKGAKVVVEDGIRFQSKLEAQRYRYWVNLWHVKAIRWFIRQAPFHLPGGVIYRADFLVALPVGILVEDVKGWMTEVSRLKIKQVEAIYGITVQIIKKGDF